MAKDPTISVIAAHQAAVMASRTACNALQELCETAPQIRGTNHIWGNAEACLHFATEAQVEAERMSMRIMPTTAEGKAALERYIIKMPGAYVGPDPVIVALAAYRNVTSEIRQPAMPWRRWRQPNQRLTQTAHP